MSESNKMICYDKDISIISFTSYFLQATGIYFICSSMFPKQTSKYTINIVTNFVWLGLETYTSIQMKMKKNIEQTKTFIFAKLPFIKNWCKDNTANNMSVRHISKDGNNCEKEESEIQIIQNQQLSLVLQNNKAISMKEYIFKPTDYKLLACNLVLHDKSRHTIELSSTKYYGHFYVEGNILLSRSFLKFYFKNCMKNNKVVEMLDNNYEIHIIDNNVNQIILKPDKAIELHASGLIIIDFC